MYILVDILSKGHAGVVSEILIQVDTLHRFWQIKRLLII